LTVCSLSDEQKMTPKRVPDDANQRKVPLLAPWVLVLRPRVDRAREVLSFATRRARQAHLTQVAGSLTFSTVLSLVPLLAVALALFTVFPQFGDLRDAVERNLVRDLLPEPFGSTILRYLNEFAAKANRVGEAGIAVFALTALTMVMTVDQALNDIWRVVTRRALVQRVLVYWALITAGPVLIAASLTLTSMVASMSLGLLHQLPRSIRSALAAAPFVFSCLLFTALYIVVPNRRVDWRDALTGGVVAGVLAELLSRGFASYVSHGSVLTVYGAFAVVPVFLLWIYFSWLTVLFGAAIAATVSGLRATRFADETRAGNRFVTAVGLVKLLLEARLGASIGERSTLELAVRIRSPEEEVTELLFEMERLGYVRQLASSQSGRSGRWILTCDPEKTALAGLFHRLAVDPANTLMPSSSLGLEAWLRPGLFGAWLQTPLAKLKRAES
jgi:membrane protein